MHFRARESSACPAARRVSVYKNFASGQPARSARLSVVAANRRKRAANGRRTGDESGAETTQTPLGSNAPAALIAGKRRLHGCKRSV